MTLPEPLMEERGGRVIIEFRLDRKEFDRFFDFFYEKIGDDALRMKDDRGEYAMNLYLNPIGRNYIEIDLLKHGKHILEIYITPFPRRIPYFPSSPPLRRSKREAEEE